MEKKISSLLSVDTNAKTVKGQKRGYLTGILYLAPSNESGTINVCPHASAGCRAACLYTAGMGSFSNVKQARINKTLWFARDRESFVAQIKKDIAALIRKAKRMNLIPCVRLNGTSDLPFENFGIMQEFPDIAFYDYTKNAKRMKRFLAGEMPANYSLTFSRSETKRNHRQCEEIAKLGGNVAAVFAGKTLPKTYKGKRVFNGDNSDLRFLDPTGVIVGLTAKGMARKDNSGFTINN
tara:strand:- start:407 stop:1117 length:711 start_codon:yes stop_codon:yes gene_type:complete